MHALFDSAGGGGNADTIAGTHRSWVSDRHTHDPHATASLAATDYPLIGTMWAMSSRSCDVLLDADAASSERCSSIHVSEFALAEYERHQAA